MKYILTLCLLLSTMMTYAQTSPSTGSCPADGCDEDYSAAYLDPATTMVNNAFNGGGSPVSYLQVFGGSPLFTEITCVCFDVFTDLFGYTVIPETITINVYSYDSTNPFTIANLGAPIGSAMYTYTGAEALDQTICLNIVPSMGVSLAPGDDTFVIEYFDPLGIANLGWVNPSPFGGNVTYFSFFGNGPTLVGVPFDMILEINGCVRPPCEAEGGSFSGNE